MEKYWIENLKLKGQLDLNVNLMTYWVNDLLIFTHNFDTKNGRHRLPMRKSKQSISIGTSSDGHVFAPGRLWWLWEPIKTWEKKQQNTVSQPMINWWFGARFGFLGFPYERDCYLRVPDSNPKPPGPKPPINHYLSASPPKKKWLSYKLTWQAL